MDKIVKVEDGFIKEYDECGSCRNSYGSGNIIQAVVSGNRVIALAQGGYSIEEYENNCMIRSYGLQGHTKQIVVSGDKIVAIMENGGSIYEYKDGCYQRNYACNVESVFISGDTVIAKLSDGRTEEYENGSLIRSGY